MEYKKGIFDEEDIPEFALQPAKPAPSLDPTAYDRLFENLKQSAESKEPRESKGPKEPKEPKEPKGPKESNKTKKAEAIVIPETIAAFEDNSDEIKDVKAEVMQEEAVEVDSIEEEAVEVASIEEEAVEVASIEEEAVEVASIEEEAVEVASIEEEAVEEASIEEESVEVASIEEEAAEVAEPIKEQVEPVVSVTVNPVVKPLLSDAVKEKETIAVSSNRQGRKIKYTDFSKLDPITIAIEEDVLISDTKPDMVGMLNVSGSCRLNERTASVRGQSAQTVRVSGDLKIQALYVAENSDNQPVIIAIDSRIPFREDCTLKAGQNAELMFQADVQSIKWERINERKFRVYATVEIDVREYCQDEMNVFEGIENEQLQFLHGEIEFTDMAVRKSDVMEIAEDIVIPEGAAEIDKILCYDVNIAEGHKQISSEKAMISGAILTNVLYKSVDGPQFYNFKTDVTHFMRISDDDFALPLVGGRTYFNIIDCTLTPKRDEDGYYNILALEMEVEITLEYYRQVQEPCIVDMYHFTKDVKFDMDEKQLNCLCGSGTIDTSIREIIDIPEGLGRVGKVVYITGTPQLRSEIAQKGKIEIEGVLPVKVVCTGIDSNKQPFSIHQNLDFKADLDIPDCKEKMGTDCQAVVKDLGFDQINNRQIAINAEISVLGFAFAKASAKLISNVSVTEKPAATGLSPSIIVYAVKEGDTVWKVSKRYHTPVGRLRTINDLADREEVTPGTKVLIVK